MEIEFPPHLCNKKCPRETKTGFKLSPQSYVSIPPGTKLSIFVNVDPDDPDSDAVSTQVITANKYHIHAILVDPLPVKKM